MKGVSDRVALMCYLWSQTPYGNILGETSAGEPVRMLRCGEAVSGRGFFTMRGAEVEVGTCTLRGSVIILDDDMQWSSLSMAEEDQRVECAEVPAMMFVAHKRIIILNLFPGQERKYFFSDYM